MKFEEHHGGAVDKLEAAADKLCREIEAKMEPVNAPDAYVRPVVMLVGFHYCRACDRVHEMEMAVAHGKIDLGYLGKNLLDLGATMLDKEDGDGQKH
jgi:hypothetical protein